MFQKLFLLNIKHEKEKEASITGWLPDKGACLRC